MRLPHIGLGRSIAILLTAAALMAGCGQGVDSNDSELDQRRHSLTERAVREAVEGMLADLVAGDWGAYWDNWTRDSQAIMNRDNYIALNQHCASPTSYEYEVGDVEVISADEANVHTRAPALRIDRTVTVVRQTEKWRLQLPATDRSVLAQGLEQLKARGLCPLTATGAG